MWHILLDHSGSMGGSFTGRTNPSEIRGRVRVSRQSIKLDAAKESLLEHLEGLPTVEPLTILGFTSATSTIFRGDTSQVRSARRALTEVEPTNGTDIAQALRHSRHLLATAESQRLIRVLVITDGLSDAADARLAARELDQAVDGPVVIDVILIDHTDKGDATARAIALRGSVQSVTSAGQLDRATRDYFDERRADFPRDHAGPPASAEAPPASAAPSARAEAPSARAEAPSEGVDSLPLPRAARTRVIGPPVPALLALAALALVIVAFLLSRQSQHEKQNVVDSPRVNEQAQGKVMPGSIEKFEAIRSDLGARISWTANEGADFAVYQVWGRDMSDKTLLVETIFASTGVQTYEAVDESREACNGQRVAYRITGTANGGDETSSPWFNVEPSSREARQTQPIGNGL